MMDGFRPSVRRRELPLTQACEAAVAGAAGLTWTDIADYRGVPVVGAWTWLPEYGLGMITEIEFAEAYRPLTILK